MFKADCIGGSEFKNVQSERIGQMKGWLKTFRTEEKDLCTLYHGMATQKERQQERQQVVMARLE